jgi:hypothetical protein
MLKVCFCAKEVDGLTASRQVLTSKKDYTKPPIALIFQTLKSCVIVYRPVPSLLF